MIELLKTAQNAGHHADYVLFDTWFSSPAQLIAVKKLGLDSIAMLKKSSHIYYEYEGEQLSIQKIFGICKKRRGRSKYLLSVNVMVGKDEKIPAKIVCVRNRKTGLLSSVQIPNCPKKRSSGSTESGGRLRYSLRHASPICN